MRDRRLLIVLFLAAAVVGGASWLWLDGHGRKPPLTPEQQYAAGLEAIARRDFETARTASDALDALPAFRDHARVLRAGIQLKSGRPDKAIELLKDRPVDRRARIQASVFLAEAFFVLRDLENSLRAAQYAVNADRENVEGHWWSAAAFYDLGLNDPAIEELKAVGKLKPSDYRSHYLMGMILLETEQLAEAAASLQRSLDLKPPKEDEVDVILHLAHTLLRLRRYDEAAALLAGRSEGNAELLALDSQAQWAQGKQDQAKRSIDRAERISPENRFVLLQRARILIHDGELPAAASRLEKSLAQEPHDMETRYQLALCYRKMQMPARYEAEMARYEQTKQMKREISDLTVRSMQEPANAPVRDQLAVLYEKLGRPKVAASYRQAAEACRRLKQNR